MVVEYLSEMEERVAVKQGRRLALTLFYFELQD
jgi:hypothetical protein